jgi:hypothetical protein
VENEKTSTREIPYEVYEVLKRLAKGMNKQEVAAALHCSMVMVNTHLRKLRGSLCISAGDQHYVEDLVRRFRSGAFTQKPLMPKQRKAAKKFGSLSERRQEEAARWNKIFQEKFADRSYYGEPRQPVGRSSLIPKT